MNDLKKRQVPHTSKRSGSTNEALSAPGDAKLPKTDDAADSAQDEPKLSDPVAELLEALVETIVKVNVVVRYAEPEAVVTIKHPRLEAAIQQIYDRWLDLELSVRQSHSGKGRAPNKEMPIAAEINETLRELGWNERVFWGKFYAKYGPFEPAAQRQAALRAARRKDLTVTLFD
jgi:hypothetical protein